MSFTLQPSVILPVNYDDLKLWSISDNREVHVNCHPHMGRDFFPINVSGRKAVQFGFLISNTEFTTGEGLRAISEMDVFRPNLADSHAFSLDCPEDKKILPLTCFCGADHFQYDVPFIAYLQIDRIGQHLFFNWMTFRRPAGSALLVVMN